MPTRRCPNCGEWIDKSLLFCPLCRVPLVKITPTHHRPTAIIGFAIVLAVIIALVLLGVRSVVR